MGTFLAFIGTIALSTTETRRREAADYDRARLTGAALYFKLKGLSNVLDDLGYLDQDGTPQEYKYLNFSQRLGNSPMWTAEDLVPLVVLQNHAAFHMEIARAKIEFCATNLSTAAVTGEYSENPLPYITGIRATLLGAQKSINIALAEVERILPNIHPD